MSSHNLFIPAKGNIEVLHAEGEQFDAAFFLGSKKEPVSVAFSGSTVVATCAPGGNRVNMRAKWALFSIVGISVNFTGDVVLSGMSEDEMTHVVKHALTK